MTTLIDRAASPLPVEVHGAVGVIPSVEEIERLTAVAERRVVFRNVGWSFYENLSDRIPEGSRVHVDFDGKDVEVMGTGRKHEKARRLLRRFVDTITEELGISCNSVGETTWKRMEMTRGLEADECYYFLPEKLAADARALARGSDNIADYPNPDLAIEVDISPPQIDRAGIYAALGVTEVWRFDGRELVIERLTPEGKYEAVEASGFLPVRVEDVVRWVVLEDSTDQSAWARRLRAEMGTKKRT